MMDTAEKLEKLRIMARGDEKIRFALLETRKAEDPLRSFCETAGQLGISVSPWEMVSYGEESYAERRRSTNGGGENSPLLEWSDDYYELLMAELETAGERKNEL